MADDVVPDRLDDPQQDDFENNERIDRAQAARWEQRYVEVERENERLRDVMAEAQRMLGELRPDVLAQTDELARLRVRAGLAERLADALREEQWRHRPYRTFDEKPTRFCATCDHTPLPCEPAIALAAALAEWDAEVRK